MALTVNATRYTGIGTTSIRADTNVEGNRQTIQRVDGFYYSMYIRITANAATSASTVRFRKNGANGNQNVSIGAGATGVFQDLVNIDNVSAGDLLSTEWVTGTVGAITVSLLSFIFDSEDVTQLVVLQAAAWDYTLTSTNTNRFSCPIGDIAANATEVNSRLRYRVNARIRNLTARVITNNRTTDTTVASRKNGANGNMGFTIGAGATGTFADLSNVDVINPGDDFDQMFTMGNSAESLVTAIVQTTYITEEHAYPIIAGFDGGVAHAFNSTFYYPIGGSLNSSRSATETDVQLPPRSAVRAFALAVRVSANTIATDATTVTVRKNAADTVLSVSIGAGATGIFENLTNSINFGPDDLMNYAVVTPNTSGSLTFTQMGIFAGQEAAQMDAIAVPLQTEGMAKSGSKQSMGLTM
jgi:hypothetical protein